jgi:hypothetical protein
MVHRCAEWDGWEEGLVDSLLGSEEDEEGWFRDFNDEEDHKERKMVMILFLMPVMEAIRTDFKRRASTSPLVRTAKLTHPPALLRVPHPPISKRHYVFCCTSCWTWYGVTTHFSIIARFD